MGIDIGERLREVRTAHALSQRQLAQRCGVTNGMISMIEQNRASPTVSSLKKILDGLPMSLAEFFTIGVTQNDQYIFRASDFVDIAPQGSGLERGNHGNVATKPIMYRMIKSASSPIELLHEIYEPGGDTSDELYTHLGHECGYVVAGQIELTISENVHLLSEGDGYSFPSELPHRFRNPTDKRAEIVSACTPASF